MISNWIKDLKEIKKEELDERSFYEQVLSVIRRVGIFDFTPDVAEELRQTLQEIGCLKYDDWKEEKEKSGEKVEEPTFDDGIRNANVEMAVSMVSQLLGEYDSANFGLRMMFEERMISKWLRNSQEKYPAVKRIMKLANKRKTMKKEIKQEEKNRDDKVK